MDAESPVIEIEIPLYALHFGKVHVVDDDVTLEIETDPENRGCYKGRIKIGGNLGKRLAVKRKVKARRKI